MTHEYNILIKLLEDPDPEVYNVLTERILEHGTDIIPYLEDAGKSSLSKFHFERINQLTSEIIFRDNKERLASWIQDGGVDLVEGFYFLHRIIHPDSKQSEIIDAIQNI